MKLGGSMKRITWFNKHNKLPGMPSGKFKPAMLEQIRKQAIKPIHTSRLKSKKSQHHIDNTPTHNERITGLLFFIILAGAVLFSINSRTIFPKDSKKNPGNTNKKNHEFHSSHNAIRNKIKPTTDNKSGAQLAIDMAIGLKKNITDVCQMPGVRSICNENLGIPRVLMPQLDEQALKNYITQKKNNYKIESHHLPSEKLIPTQKELDATKIFRIFHEETAKKNKSVLCKQSILVAKNKNRYYIIDGHHRAVACRLANGQQNAIVIEDSADRVLSELGVKIN